MATSTMTVELTETQLKLLKACTVSHRKALQCEVDYTHDAPTKVKGYNKMRECTELHDILTVVQFISTEEARRKAEAL